MFKKIRNWMAFNPPTAASIDGWEEFNRRFKEEAPIRYFIMRGKVWKMRFRVRFFFRRIWEYFVYRYVNRYHVVDSNLTPGYYEAGTLILHTNFSILIDYVEVTAAFKRGIGKEDYKRMVGMKRFLPWPFTRKLFRSREFGIDQLKWEMDLTEESPQQAEHAREVLYLYIWWKDIRPKRKPLECPLELDREHPLAVLSDNWRKENPEQYKLWKDWADASNKEEEEWREEDDLMLERLIKVRHGLY